MDEKYFSAADILPDGEGRLIGLGTRPGDGKTTLLLDIMFDYAVRGKEKTLYFSLEAPKKWITDMIAVKRRLTGEELLRITVDEGAAFPTAEYVENAIEKCDGVKAIFIDYISLLHGDMQNILERLKRICKEKGADIFYGCCLPKSAAADGRPTLADFNTAGGADLLLAIYRPEYDGVLPDNNAPGELMLLKGGGPRSIPLYYDRDKKAFYTA